MPQGLLNFSIESTSEMLTSHSGTILFGEYLKATRIDTLCNTHLPQPGNHRGYEPFEHIQPLLLMLHSGGRVLEDVRMIHQDKALRSLLKMDNVPIAESIGKWLGRHGLMGVYGMEAIHRKILKRYLKPIQDPLILDIDASVILSQKSTAQTTYKKQTGYTPMIGHINGGFVIHSEFRSGNIAPADNNLSFVQHCKAQLPEDKTLRFLRADAASYQAKLFDWCQKENITYFIGGQRDSSVCAEIEALKGWEPLRTKEGSEHYLKEEVSEFIHTMDEAQYAFRMIVIKKSIAPMLPGIWDLLSDEEKAHYSQERYHVIATNADSSMSPQEVVRFYRQRAETSENKIKELKNGFNLSYLPSSNFMANAFYFQIGVLAYNLFLLFKQLLQTRWHKHTVATLRYKLYHIAGKVVYHARQHILKIPEAFVTIFQTIREKILSIALE